MAGKIRLEALDSVNNVPLFESQCIFNVYVKLSPIARNKALFSFIYKPPRSKHSIVVITYV